MALSTLVFVVGVLLWGIVLGATQIQCVDGARVGARAAARGEPTEAVRDAVRSVAPENSDIAISTEGRSGARKVRVTVRAGMDGPGPLTLPLEAEAVGFLEPGAGADP
ncbi:TadE family type IV pilus minor pilin [Streptomyces oceani]|uniref:TadE family type IV pilus minor pilin n=1 Tax=Streptomyces oceani TaxID=1075402 RepID=UPI001FCD193D|nr:TadE family type IV pilus minor pilin [Streptomyces oceani]